MFTKFTSKKCITIDRAAAIHKFLAQIGMQVKVKLTCEII